MKRSDERGVALLLALLVLTLLVAIILDFDAEARREFRDAAVFRDGLKATTIARAGIQAARAVLRQDSLLESRTKLHYDGPGDLWMMPLTNFPLGDGIINAVIEDERSKLNLNLLGGLNDPVAKRSTVLRFKRLFELIQVDPRVVDAIVDWIDADEAPEADGGESSYYQTLRPPYRAANEPLQSLEELRLVKGVTQDMIDKMVKYVTVFPSQADGRINLNTAHLLVLQALDLRISSAIAGEIIQGRPYKTMQDLDRISSFEPIAKELRLTQAYDIKSQFFSIRGTVRVNEAVKSVLGVVKRDETKGDTTLLFVQIR
jgi:general secretion pathway protein K